MRIWIDKKKKLHIGKLSLGPAEDVPELESVSAFKATAALIAREARKEAGELRRKELVNRIESSKYKGGGFEFKIMSSKAREEQTPIAQENLEEIWKEFEVGKYTHLRLVVRDKEYELLSVVRDRKVDASL